MSTSYRIIERVKRAISNDFLTASDTDVARVLKISRAAVSAYKHGKDCMSLETLLRANAVLKLDRIELADVALELQCQLTPKARAIWEAQRWLIDQAKKHVAVILIAVLGVSGAAIPEVSHAAASDQSIHYAKSRRRRKQDIFAIA